jgi:hypothetical protein
MFVLEFFMNFISMTRVRAVIFEKIAAKYSKGSIYYEK